MRFGPRSQRERIASQQIRQRSLVHAFRLRHNLRNRTPVPRAAAPPRGSYGLLALALGKAGRGERNCSSALARYVPSAPPKKKRIGVVSPDAGSVSAALFQPYFVLEEIRFRRRRASGQKKPRPGRRRILIDFEPRLAPLPGLLLMANAEAHTNLVGFYFSP